MSTYTTINILDMADAIGEESLIGFLSDYSCPKNPEIETYVKNSALEFAKRKISITYLVLNDNGDLTSIFTVTHKPIEISREGLSSTLQKKLTRYAQLDETTDSYTLSAFLIAQFGKNYAHDIENIPSGNELMEITINVLEKIQRDIGGGIVYLECEDKPQLLEFYQNEHNRFRIFGKRISLTDHVPYIQLLRIL